MSDATFACPDLTTFCRLDELGLGVTGQRLEPGRAVLACRVTEPDEWCHRCGCLGSQRDTVKRVQVVVNEKCKGCDFCVKQFECPALQSQGKEQPILIDPMLCVGCGLCVHVCPHKALEVAQDLWH